MYDRYTESDIHLHHTQFLCPSQSGPGHREHHAETSLPHPESAGWLHAKLWCKLHLESTHVKGLKRETWTQKWAITKHLQWFCYHWSQVLYYFILGIKESMMTFQRQNEIMCTVLLLWFHNTLPEN